MVGRSRLISLDDASEIELDVVTEERPTYNTTVTDYPIEGGVSASDHVHLRPITTVLNGVVAGNDAADKLATLKRWRNERHRLRYVGQNILRNSVMSEFTTGHDVSVSDGFSFRIGLQQVQVAQLSMVDITLPDPVYPDAEGTSAQTDEVDNAGRQQPVPSGHPALSLRTDWETVMSYEEALKYASRYGGMELLEGHPMSTSDQLEYVPFDKARVPYKSQVRIQGISYEFGFWYNSRRDFFTVDLFRDGLLVTEGEPIVYNQPLFQSVWSEFHPNVAIIPFGVSGAHFRVGWNEMGNDVQLYIIDPREVPR